jgi:hypothetical protein
MPAGLKSFEGASVGMGLGTAGELGGVGDMSRQSVWTNGCDLVVASSRRRAAQLAREAGVDCRLRELRPGSRVSLVDPGEVAVRRFRASELASEYPDCVIYEEC